MKGSFLHADHPTKGVPIARRSSPLLIIPLALQHRGNNLAVCANLAPLFVGSNALLLRCSTYLNGASGSWGPLFVAALHHPPKVLSDNRRIFPKRLRTSVASRAIAMRAKEATSLRRRGLSTGSA